MVRLGSVAYLAQHCHHGADDQEDNPDPEQEHCSLHCNAKDEQYDSNDYKCYYDSHFPKVQARLWLGNLGLKKRSSRIAPAVEDRPAAFHAGSGPLGRNGGGSVRHFPLMCSASSERGQPGTGEAVESVSHEAGADNDEDGFPER